MCNKHLQPPAGLSKLKLEKKLQAQVDAYTKDKTERLSRAKTLRERDQHLCDVLCATPYYIPSSCVPSEAQLKELEAHISGLQKELVRVLVQFVGICKASLPRLSVLVCGGF